MSGRIILARHGESVWNAKGLWTGLTDVDITPKGRKDAHQMGEALQDVSLHHAFTSSLRRTHQTLEAMLAGHGSPLLPKSAQRELNERDYGSLTGKNKWQVKEEIGDEAFQGIRRSWDYPVPKGETLKDVHARAIPFYLQQILPRLHQDENILLVAHGNTIRALIKHLENIAEGDISGVEMVFGTLLLYEVDSGGKAIHKEIRQVSVEPSKA